MNTEDSAQSSTSEISKPAHASWHDSLAFDLVYIVLLLLASFFKLYFSYPTSEPSSSHYFAYLRGIEILLFFLLAVRVGRRICNKIEYFSEKNTDLFKDKTLSGFLLLLGCGTTLVAYSLYYRLQMELADHEGINCETAGKLLDSSHLEGTTAIDLFASLCGILIGLLVTYIVYKKSESETGKLNLSVSNVETKSNKLTETAQSIISRTTEIQAVAAEIATKAGDLDNKTTELHKDLKRNSDAMQEKLQKMIEDKLHFSAVSEYGKVVAGISEVINHAKDNTNTNLYIINPSASFGYLMTFDADVIAKVPDDIDDSKRCGRRRAEFLEITKSTFAEKQWEATKTKEVNFVSLKEIASKTQRQKKGPKVNYITLGGITETNVKTEDTPFYKEFIDHALKKASVSCFDEHNDGLSHFSDDDLTADKVFLVSKISIEEYAKHRKNIKEPLDDNEKNEHRQFFKNFLIWDHTRRIAALKDSFVTVKQVNEVPLQMFLSYSTENSANCRCLILFSNKFTIGTTSNLAAFITKDSDICRVFYQMWNAINLKHND